MPRPIQDGAYYEFNRPDGHYEFGSEIQESTAQTRVRYGFDVYTPRASDAKALAKKVAPYIRGTRITIFRTITLKARITGISLRKAGRRFRALISARPSSTSTKELRRKREPKCSLVTLSIGHDPSLAGNRSLLSNEPGKWKRYDQR
jgi:hypothetical protein